MASAQLHLGLVSYLGGDAVLGCRLPFHSTLWCTHLPLDGGGCKSPLFFRPRAPFTLDGLKRTSHLLDVRPPAGLPESSTGTPEPREGGRRADEDVSAGGGGRGGQDQEDGRREVGKELSVGAVASAIEEVLPFKDFNIVAACAVGLITGIGVVLFNYAVHEIRDTFWDGIPARGASWLREEPLGEIWQRVVLVPACGGIIVSLLNNIRSNLETQSKVSFSTVKEIVVRPFLKALAAAVTLGTGNSLGPEGPSVEIGVSVAKGVNTIFDTNRRKNLSLVAAGSAAGISSG
ncbi:hypothetical protein Taro_048786 [Colocasia esculenta]|uniref:Chloride channel protein n=1 Tax=Colocasia esculenta TaxID=4460 RepID=A0A843X922_COLES|nr:hypothetical protein [Colocasia esculenta]